MLLKRLLLGVIIIAVYVNWLIYYPSDSIKKLGANQAIDFYAHLISPQAPVKLVHNPGLRDISIDNDSLNIKAVLPGTKPGAATVDLFLASQAQVIIECSELDSWHTSESGRPYLHKIREQGYRVVIFDGGHHLPTLGLEPDLIIMPVMNGYVLHSYMLDGIKTEKVVDIIEEINAPIVAAQVSRWYLVKNEKSLIAITDKALKKAGPATRSDETLIPKSNNKMSKYNNTILAYIDKTYSQDINLFFKNLKQLGIAEVNKVYLAFDYRWISVDDADEYVNKLSELSKLKVEKVNEPVKVSNSFWGGLLSVLEKQKYNH